MLSYAISWLEHHFTRDVSRLQTIIRSSKKNLYDNFLKSMYLKMREQKWGILGINALRFNYINGEE